MKPTTLLLIFTFFAMPGIVYAESPFSSLQSAKEKTTVLQDLRKICTPQASLSDEAWEKLMLSDENNKQHIREAIVAMERNNQSNYWEALVSSCCCSYISGHSTLPNASLPDIRISSFSPLQ